MFTEEQRVLLNSKLDPKNVRQRNNGNFKLSYIEGWFAIKEANRIFGFDGWSRVTEYCKEVCRYLCEIGKGDYKSEGFKVGYEAKVIITVGNVSREGTGHGSGISKDLFDAIEGAAKEAETDATKRALMTFGNSFGLALYDKNQEDVGVDYFKTASARKKAYEEIYIQLNECVDLEHLKNIWVANKDMLRILEQDASNNELIMESYRQLVARKDELKELFTEMEADNG